MNNLKEIKTNIVDVFSNWKNVLIFLIFFGLIISLFNHFTHFELILGNFGVVYTYSQVILQYLIAVLFALYIPISTHKFFKFNTLSFKNSATTGAGTFLGVLVAGCPACSVSLASYIGLAGVISLLPWHGLELKIIAVPMLIYANYSLLKDLNTCKLK